MKNPDSIEPGFFIHTLYSDLVDYYLFGIAKVRLNRFNKL